MDSKKSSITLSLAPIQGITNYSFRNLFHKYFKGVDKYYTPYLRMDKKLEIEPKKLKDILPENNQSLPVIPQIMVNTSKAFFYLSEILSDFGYTEVNWNLGCPYPMVTNRMLGAGLLTDHNKIVSILNDVVDSINMNISIKIRSGLTDSSEVEKILPKLDAYPLSEIIIHPRYAKQLYKDNADVDLYSTCLGLSKHKLGYNGDITDKSSFLTIKEKTGNTSHFMLGRGLIANPFLAEQIKSGEQNKFNLNLSNFWGFENELFQAVSERVSGEGQIAMHMANYWSYFSQSFSNSSKVFKRFKKARKLSAYYDGVAYAKEYEEWKW